MAHPKRRHSNTRSRIRRSHDGLKPQSASVCAQCGATTIPHRVCKKCGYYRGRPVIVIKVKESAKEK